MYATTWEDFKSTLAKTQVILKIQSFFVVVVWLSALVNEKKISNTFCEANIQKSF